MTRLGWTVLLSGCAVLGIIVVLAAWRHAAVPVQHAPSSQASTTAPVTNPSELSIYTSGEYGFSLFYPAAAHVTDAFSTTTGQALPWRVQASATGTPIVRIQANGEEVRVGVSAAVQELAACQMAGHGEAVIGAQKIGTTTWQEYSFDRIGTDDQQQVTSYRTVHAKRCYALELLQPLGRTASSSGYTLEQSIMSFTFAS